MNADTIEINTLTASGFTYTSTDFLDLAEALVNQAKINFKGKNEKIEAHVWAYIEQGYECLSCDLFTHGDVKLTMPIIITAAEEYDFSVIDEPDVKNMVEALHLTRLIVSALKATVRVGKHQNETNDSLFNKPFEKGQTNAAIDLTFDDNKPEAIMVLPAIKSFFIKNVFNAGITQIMKTGRHFT